jgi:hypothetical protein
MSELEPFPKHQHRHKQSLDKQAKEGDNVSFIPHPMGNLTKQVKRSLFQIYGGGLSRDLVILLLVVIFIGSVLVVYAIAELSSRIGERPAPTSLTERENTHEMPVSR